MPDAHVSLDLGLIPVFRMQLGICMVFLNFSATNMIAVENYYRSGNISCLESVPAPAPAPGIP